MVKDSSREATLLKNYMVFLLVIFVHPVYLRVVLTIGNAMFL